MRRRPIWIVVAALTACSPPAASTFTRPSIPAPPDVHSAGTEVTFAAVGDIGDGSASEGRVAAAIATYHRREPLDFVLLLGDLIYPEGDPAAIESRFRIPFRPVLEAGLPVRAVLGNHDIVHDGDRVAAGFGMNERYYSFRAGDAAFFALDSSNGTIPDVQRKWLEQELGVAAESWKIVALHHPLYSSGIHGSTLPVRDAIENLMTSNRVALVLAAHDHDYERTKPINGVTYVVTGGGCCPRPGPMIVNDFTAFFASGLEFVVVNVTARTIRVRLVDISGATLDSDQISKP